jgi:hypothetical protein
MLGNIILWTIGNWDKKPSVKINHLYSNSIGKMDDVSDIYIQRYIQFTSSISDIWISDIYHGKNGKNGWSFNGLDLNFPHGFFILGREFRFRLNSGPIFGMCKKYQHLLSWEISCVTKIIPKLWHSQFSFFKKGVSEFSSLRCRWGELIAVVFFGPSGSAQASLDTINRRASLLHQSGGSRFLRMTLMLKPSPLSMGELCVVDMDIINIYIYIYIYLYLYLYFYVLYIYTHFFTLTFTFIYIYFHIYI